ncbi:N-acetylmuramoyl-L-alanine amidase [[Muricauda] lutisoli]|uniref:N-acetylmuramoyl-L-alanine amidase n=1 Tax=[Muricauda] lutisoli TaxID=2816035 RepID=A0ABS3EWB7_9FLAO|nr:N-acetylmuramoyl-L-alanine amidase [[Muricauda] lutisoli]MBO0330531.1 N-acetylmuramoyl-L-alanine amidase [[Muricauda] lutisoli]
MKSRLTLLFWVWACTFLFGQENPYYNVVAEQGDGIFSLLRKQGLDPVKHYGTFLELNAEKIKEGTLLKLGENYKVPYTDDSFKKTGVLIEAIADVEEPIFDKELAQMYLKSDKLKDAVYYLITDNTTEQDKNFVADITQRLAAELMVHGAKVYVMGDEVSNNMVRDSLSVENPMGDYTKAINKRYIQNTGKYQRVLLIRAENITGSGNLDVAVYHYNKSTQGQRFAENIQNVFKENSVSNTTFDEASLIFEDKNSLYLARNILPAISLITLENTSRSSNKISLRSNRKEFANLISNGIINDYVDIEFEN